VGANNKIKGKSNVVIGSNNTINGNKNWVFDSNVNVKGIADGVLIVDHYLIEMADIRITLIDPRKVIRCVQSDQKQQQIQRWDIKAAISYMNIG
jgi:hypothetical protein